MLSTKIAWLLGRGSLKDFETVREAEVNDFRTAMIDKCRTAIDQRNAASWEEKVLYHYPPDIESSAEISQLVATRLSPQVSKSHCQVCVQIFSPTFDPPLEHIHCVNPCLYRRSERPPIRSVC